MIGDNGLSWDDFLNPEVMRPKLISASIYIAVFEVLKDAIVARVRNFYWSGFDESGDIIDPRYGEDVLIRNKSLVYASLDWLKEYGALSVEDFTVFEAVKAYRNDIAHRIVGTLGSLGVTPEYETRFHEMVNLLRKIEVWWIVNFEIPVNPDAYDYDIDESEIVPGTIASLQILMRVALGDEAENRQFLNEFRQMVNRGRHKS